MLHSIEPEKFGPLGEPMAHAIQSCVHCGFCLAACPTYRELGQEMDTPRGRIVLMKQALEGTLPWERAQPHVDRCLGCLACEPACPSGVPYRDLISAFRAVAQPHFRRSFGEKLRRFLAAQTIPFPARFRLAAMAGRLGKMFRALMPRALRPMLDLVPDSIPPEQTWPLVTPARGERRARVALLAGCAQQVLDPDINTATIEVLARNGVEVLVPRAQGHRQGCFCRSVHQSSSSNSIKMRRSSRRRGEFIRRSHAVVRPMAERPAITGPSKRKCPAHASFLG